MLASISCMQACVHTRSHTQDRPYKSKCGLLAIEKAQLFKLLVIFPSSAPSTMFSASASYKGQGSRDSLPYSHYAVPSQGESEPWRLQLCLGLNSRQLPGVFLSLVRERVPSLSSLTEALDSEAQTPLIWSAPHKSHLGHL